MAGASTDGGGVAVFFSFFLVGFRSILLCLFFISLEKTCLCEVFPTLLFLFFSCHAISILFLLFVHSLHKKKTSASAQRGTTGRHF